MRLFLICLLVFTGSTAAAAILNWDSRINLTQERTELVVEKATMLETAWSEGNIQCVFDRMDDLELTKADFFENQVQSFVITANVTVSGPTCPGQVFQCESIFTWLGPLEWDVKTTCEDPS
ncbi:MAG: hypothetical protein ACK5P7_02340 [Bdellovibrio sp.]|jgi:hypothetical protein